MKHTALSLATCPTSCEFVSLLLPWQQHALTKKNSGVFRHVWKTIFSDLWSLWLTIIWSRQPFTLVDSILIKLAGNSFNSWGESGLHYRPFFSIHRKKPNLIVHLDVSPAESKRRIDMRQRECESSISLEYLQNLHSAYEEFIQDISRIIPVIRVNYERFRTADEMAEMIVRWVVTISF